MKEKYQLPIIAGSIVLIFAIFIGVVLLTSDDDEIKKRYKEVMTELDNKDYFYVTQTRETIYTTGEQSLETNEVWANGESFAKSGRNDFMNDTLHTYELEVQLSRGEKYRIYVDETGEKTTSKYSGTAWLFSKITYFNSKFSFCWDENISYVEKEDGWIVTYDAKNMIGERVESRPSDSTYIEASSVCYFDKNWNVQKIELLEVYQINKEDGSVQECEQKTTILFDEMSREDIEQKINEAYEKILKEF